MNRFNRRGFIGLSSLLAAPVMALAAGVGSAGGGPDEGSVKDNRNERHPEQKSGRIVHHVFFWLKRPGNADDRAMLAEGLATLRGMSEVKELFIGKPANTMKRDVVDNSFDLSELIWFDSAKDQDVYQTHPIHLAFVEKYSHLWDKVVVHDMELI